MNILILHQLGDPRFYRKAVSDLEFCVPHYAPEHNYIVHDADLPLPEFVKDISFHGIILGPTFLCSRYEPDQFSRVNRLYDFIRQSPAYKIALPQDDYDCSAILDRWMVDWHVDLLYPVCPEHWDVLYPNFSRVGKLKLGYTGYVSEDMIDRWRNPKTLEQRRIDVSYRARKLAPHFGRLGHLKGVIGDLFIEAAKDSGLRLDISTHHRRMIPGTAWHDFLEDSRFVLGTNSGSSLLDPEGRFRHCVYKALAVNPDASFEDVEAACFPGEDSKYSFTALSPRNIECALIKSVQLLTPGSYSGVLRAHEHYVLLQPDLSNMTDVIRAIRDLSRAQKIADICKDAVLSVDALRYTRHVAELIREIEAGSNRRMPAAAGSENQAALFMKYERYMKVVAQPFWLMRGLRMDAGKIRVSLGWRAKKLFKALRRKSGGIR